MAQAAPAAGPSRTCVRLSGLSTLPSPLTISPVCCADQGASTVTRHGRCWSSPSAPKSRSTWSTSSCCSACKLPLIMGWLPGGFEQVSDTLKPWPKLGCEACASQVLVRTVGLDRVSGRDKLVHARHMRHRFAHGFAQFEDWLLVHMEMHGLNPL